MFVIFILGGTSSGKTTFARRLKDKISGSALISQDNYHKDMSHLTRVELSSHNFDKPDSLNLDDLAKDIITLSENGSVMIPHYDFKEQISTKNQIEVKKPKVLIVEGLFLVQNELLNNLSDFNVFIDIDSDVRLSRRILRDVKERGDTVEEIIERYLKYVKVGHDKFIQPQIDECQIIVKEKKFDEKLDFVYRYIKDAVS